MDALQKYDIIFFRVTRDGVEVVLLLLPPLLILFRLRPFPARYMPQSADLRVQS